MRMCVIFFLSLLSSDREETFLIKHETFSGAKKNKNCLHSAVCEAFILMFFFLM